MTRLPLPARLKSFHSYRGAPSEPTSAVNSRSSSPVRAPALGSHNNGHLMLKVHVIKARNLAPKDKHQTSDPYLVLTLGDARDSTVPIAKNLNPEWNETIELPVEGLHSLLLEVKCWDKDRFGKDYMGEFDVALEDIFPTWYHLESRKTGRKKSVVTGEVLLEFSLYDPLHTSATPHQLQQKLLAMVASSSDLDADDEHGLEHVDSAEVDEDDDEDEHEHSHEHGHEHDHNENLSRAETQKRHRRLKLAKLKKQAKQRAYEFSGVSDLAGVLFLEISKITDLPPERNMTRTSFDMDPFVVTSLGKKTYKTKVIRHNLNPVYNEKLVFQVLRHETQYSLNFSVIDRDKLSGNDFIGTVNFPVDKVSSLAPEADPMTGLYALRDPESFGPPMTESKKSRFRLPLSRSTSTNSLHKVNSIGKSGLSRSTSQTSLNAVAQQRCDNHLTPMSSNTQDSQNALQESAGFHSFPSINGQDNGPDDPDLKPFKVPIVLKNKDRWEDKHQPTLYIKAKYLPYQALRQQFWRAMLKQYDADDSGHMSKVELTTMLDTLGSTLRESTIDRVFTRFSHDGGGEEELTVDQAVIALEDLLHSFEVRKNPWLQKTKDAVMRGSRHFASDNEDSKAETDQDLESSELSENFDTEIGNIPTLHHEHHGSAGEEGDSFDANDLGDGGNEEHVVEVRECPICHQPRLTKKSDSDIITHIATCASQDWRQVNNIVMAGFVTSSQAQRKWYSKVVTRIGYGGYKLGKNSANILVQDRITGQINEERMSVYVRLGIRLLYKGLKSGGMERSKIRKLLRTMSVKQGRKYDRPDSVADIQSFINFHQLDMSEVLLTVDQFKSFNEFFYRKLKPDARPCSAPTRSQIITSPADCRSVVFNRIEEAQTVWVKGREFSVERLLGKAYPQDAKRYANGGSMGIFRLAPQDYHRFHVPVDGVMDEPKLIEGEYYTVNPMAIRSALDVYGENIRVIVPIDSVAHGRVMVICVGAMMVGSTVITRKTGEKVKRAEELGYFKFGGSTLLLLFEPGVMRFDDDLIANSQAALETLIAVGMSIGHSPNVAPHTPDRRKDRADVTDQEMRAAKRRISGSLAPSSGGVGAMLGLGGAAVASWK